MKNTIMNKSLLLGLVAALLVMSGVCQISAQSAGSIDPSIVAKTENMGGTKAKAQPTPTPAPHVAADWTGFYVGANLGWSFGKAVANTSTAFTPTGYFNQVNPPLIAAVGRQSLSPSGFNVGGQAGYNYQTRHLVVGAEADFDWVKSKTSVTSTSAYVFPSSTSFTITQTVKNNWILTARGRGGYSRGNFLFYATGGLAAANVNYQATFSDTFAAAAENGGFSKMKTGWAGGGGAEYKLGKTWSAKVEYLHVDLGRTTTTSNNLVTSLGTSNVFTHSIYVKEQLVRFGVNYHF